MGNPKSISMKYKKQLSNKTFHKQLDLDPTEDNAKIIVSSFNDLKNSTSITDELANVLTPDKTKTARFYPLPKTHKANNTGRSVIASINCNTTKLSKFVDYHIHPLAKTSHFTYKTGLTSSTNYTNWILCLKMCS